MKGPVDLNIPRIKHTEVCEQNHSFSSVHSSQSLFCIPDGNKDTVFVFQSYAFFKSMSNVRLSLTSLSSFISE